MNGRFIAATLMAVAMAGALQAQQAKRPRLIGISQIVVRAHDLGASRRFYGELLGFEEAITVLKDHTAVAQGGLAAERVSSVWFKVNNRQYIVVMPETSPSEPRFVRYAVETDDADAMRLYLKSLGYAVPDRIAKTPAGDLAFEVRDPDDHTVEVMQCTPAGLSVQGVGKHLAEDRLSRRIIHAGFSISKPESMKFYLEGFAVREFWRSDPSMVVMGAPPRPPAPGSGPLLAGTGNLKMPEGDDYIEYSVSRGAAAGRAGAARAASGGHIALLTPDTMAKTLAAVEARPAFRDYNRPHEAHVGVNHKWQGNYFDPDGTRTEFMEHDTADGLPSPMSHQPYF